MVAPVRKCGLVDVGEDIMLVKVKLLTGNQTGKQTSAF